MCLVINFLGKTVEWLKNKLKSEIGSGSPSHVDHVGQREEGRDFVSFWEERIRKVVRKQSLNSA